MVNIKEAIQPEKNKSKNLLWLFLETATFKFIIEQKQSHLLDERE